MKKLDSADIKESNRLLKIMFAMLIIITIFGCITILLIQKIEFSGVIQHGDMLINGTFKIPLISVIR